MLESQHYYSAKLTLSFNDFYGKRQSPISGRIAAKMHKKRKGSGDFRFSVVWW